MLKDGRVAGYSCEYCGGSLKLNLGPQEVPSIFGRRGEFSFLPAVSHPCNLWLSPCLRLCGGWSAFPTDDIAWVELLRHTWKETCSPLVPCKISENYKCNFYINCNPRDVLDQNDSKVVKVKRVEKTERTPECP